MKPLTATREAKRKAWKEVKQGSVVVKIYKGSTRIKRVIDGRTEQVEYPVFTVSYYDGPKRVRLNFGSAEKALAKADEVKIKLANGEAAVLKLTSNDRAMLVQSQQMLVPFGKQVNIAVSEYVEILRRLPPGMTAAQVFDSYLQRQKNILSQKTVREVVDEMVKAKSDAGRSDVHVDDMESRLGAFAEAMKMNIGDVTGATIQTYLDNLTTTAGNDGKARPVSARTKQNHFRHITGLFQFAVRRKYLAKDALDELEAIEEPQGDDSDIEIFTPAELRLLFEVVRKEMVPWLAIAAFAGLRSAELQRLDWSDIDLAEGYIEVTAAKAKTGSRRLVPITDNLLQWLVPYKQDSGPVTPFESMAKQIGWMVDDANDELLDQAEQAGKDKAARKFEWKRNGLRHSFISYRLAILKDVGAVSLEAGNSAQMVFKHYRQLVTENESKQWFAICPLADEKIIMIAGVNENSNGTAIQLAPALARA
jgi:integrase